MSEYSRGFNASANVPDFVQQQIANLDQFIRAQSYPLMAAQNDFAQLLASHGVKTLEDYNWANEDASFDSILERLELESGLVGFLISSRAPWQRFYSHPHEGGEEGDIVRDLTNQKVMGIVSGFWVDCPVDPDDAVSPPVLGLEVETCYIEKGEEISGFVFVPIGGGQLDIIVPEFN